MTKRRRENRASRTRRQIGFTAMQAGWRRAGGYDLAREGKHRHGSILSPEHLERLKRQRFLHKIARKANHTQRRYPARGNIYRTQETEPT